jgi:uncharacterized protein YigE (DUF2233 family)
LLQAIGALVVALFALWKTFPQDTQKHIVEDIYFRLQPKADIRIEPMRVADSCNAEDKLKETSGTIATYVTDIMTRNAIRYLGTKGLQIYSSRTAQGLDRVPVKYALELTLTCENFPDKQPTSKTETNSDTIASELFGANFIVNVDLTSDGNVISSVPITLGAPLLISKFYDRKAGVNSDAIMAAIFETMPLPRDLSTKLNVPPESQAAARKYGVTELMQYRAAESVFAAGNKELAAEILTNAVSTSPTFAIAYAALAEIKRSQGVEADAEGFDKKAIEIDKDYPRIPFVTKILKPAPSVKKALAGLTPTKIAEGASLVELEIKSPPARFYVFNFNPNLYRLSIGVAPTTLGQTARQFRSDDNAVFSIVGGMFDADKLGNKAPTGLLVRHGVILSPRHADWTHGGFLVIKGGFPEVIPITQFSRDGFEVSEDLLQSSLLVVDPGGHNGIKGRTPELADRAAMCIQRNGEISFVIAKGLFELFDFSDLLAEIKSLGGLGCERAMYLDGGPSAQASLALGSKNVELEGQWVIPNAIIVHRR